jgi:hypothetical protein
MGNKGFLKLDILAHFPEGWEVVQKLKELISFELSGFSE